jgi:hypothetical protein
MEDINNRGSTAATIEKKVIQPRLVIQALAFTGILYFCVGQTPPNTTRVASQSVHNSAPLLASVENSVLQHASAAVEVTSLCPPDSSYSTPNLVG